MNELRAYLESNKITQADFAKSVDRHQSAISRLVRGETEPDAALAARIGEVTQGAVPFWCWPAFVAFKPKEAAE